MEEYETQCVEEICAEADAALMGRITAYDGMQTIKKPTVAVGPYTRAIRDHSQFLYELD